MKILMVGAGAEQSPDGRRHIAPQTVTADRLDEAADLVVLTNNARKPVSAHGHPLEAAAIDGFRRALTNPGSGFNSSMYRDMRHGLPIEGEHLVGDMRRRAQAAGIASPMLEVAHAVLQTYSAKRSR